MIYSVIPIGATDDKIVYFTDSLEIVEFRNFTIFQFFSVNTSKLLVGKKNDDSPILQKTTVTIIKKYFITKAGEKNGYYIDPDTLRVIGKNSMDSLHKAQGFLFGFYNIYESTKKNSSLYESITNKIKDETVEKYIPIKKSDKSFSDTMYYYYSSNKDYTDISFSLSPEQDKLGKGKMYKCVGKFLGNPEAEKPHEKIEREISIEMKPNKANDPELIKRLCEKAGVLFQ